MKRAIVAACVLGAVFIAAVALTRDDDAQRQDGLAAAPAVTSTAASGNTGCSFATVPPDPEPCVAVQGVLAYGFLFNIQGSKQFQNWKRDNQGEYRRLTDYMAAGKPSAPIVLVTFMGSALVNVVQSYLYARGDQPLVWPPPPAKAPPGASDQTPPTPPGGLRSG